MNHDRLDRVIAVRNRKTVYRDGENSIKVFSTDYSKADVLEAALNQSRIEETGLPIPKLMEVTTIDDKWAIVSEYIKGKTLDRLMMENPERRAEYMELFVDLQMEVHRKSCPYLDKLKEKMTAKIIQCELDATTRYALHTRLEEMPRHSKTCHGDFVPSNIVIGEDGQAYILDWSHATRGNASADVAITYLRLCLDGETELAADYLNLFCEKSGTPKSYVAIWIPMIAAFLSVGANEKSRKYLLSRINHSTNDI